MIPFILAAVGGYLIGDSRKDKAVFADGGTIKPSYDIEWKDDEGDTFSDSFDTIQEAKDEIKKIQKQGGRITQTWKYTNGQYVGSFATGGTISVFAGLTEDEQREIVLKSLNNLKYDLNINSYKGVYKATANTIVDDFEVEFTLTLEKGADEDGMYMDKKEKLEVGNTEVDLGIFTEKEQELINNEFIGLDESINDYFDEIKENEYRRSTFHKW